MTDIVNNFSHPVIEDDGRNANVSWQNHLKRGSAGGVDLAYPYGSKVVAPAAGRLIADNNSGGSGGRMGILEISHPQLARIEFLHMANVLSGNVGIGAEIGLSGASGFGKDRYYDPHLHVHAYDKQGRRVNLWNYFGSSTPSKIGPVVRSGPDWAYRRPQGDLAQRVARGMIARDRLAKNYNNDGDPREEFDKGVQRTLKETGIFATLVDGKIERGGCYGIQQYAAKNGDYRQRGGVIDGRPEVLSWECFALGLERWP